MRLGGLQKTSLMDYPDQISCIVFTAGCNFRCPFCHNRELVEGTEDLPTITESYFFSFLKSRKDLLDAVVITGGEPLIQKDIEPFIKKIKSMGFLVKLDTNGSFPGILKNLLDKKLIDYIAMDIKSSPGRYGKTCNVKINIEDIKESVRVIMNSGVDYEFRTTVLRGMHDAGDFEKIGRWLEGAKKYAIQRFSNERTLDPEFEKASPYTEREMKAFCKTIRKFVNKCEVRG